MPVKTISALMLLLVLMRSAIGVDRQRDQHYKLLNVQKQICENTMATFSGKAESLELLIKAGKEGLKLAGPADHTHNFFFHQAVGNGYYYKQDFHQAKDHFELAYTEAVAANLIEKSLKSLGNLIAVYHYLGMQRKADDAAQKLKQVTEATDTLKNKSDVYYNLGLYNQQQKFYYGIALSNFLKSLALHKKVADTSKAVKSKLDYAIKLMMVAEIYLYLKQSKKALQYLNEAKPYLSQSVIFDVTAYGKFIRAFTLLNNKTEALKYYNLLYHAVGKVPGHWSELVSSNIEMANMAVKAKDFKTAKVYLDKADRQAKLDNKEILTSAVNLAYGDYYKSIGNYQLARRYYKISEHGSALYNKEQYAELLKSLTAVSILSGQQQEAAHYLSKYTSVSDSLNQEKTSLNLAEMEARFQNEYKQQKIGLLNVENKAKNIELQQEKNTRWWLIGTAVLLLVGGALIYLNYRNKQKANVLLDRKNKQLDVMNEELTAANQTKTKLFGIITHDLRGPVSHLFTFLKLQQTRPDLISEENKKKHEMELIQSSADLLLAMEDLLLWSKSQMDHFELDNEKINVAHLFTEAIRLVKDQAGNRKLKFEIGKLDCEFIHSDYNLLLTILRNLLQNAVNYAFAETVILVSTPINEQQRQTITILNHGEIIPKKRIEELLSDVHVDSKSSGYGLLIVKELTEIIGAKLTISSNTEGTTATIVFPFIEYFNPFTD